jgi:hypothetical protein
VVKRNLNAFVQCLDTGMAPAVEYGQTITATNVTSLSISNAWSLLEAQAVSGTNIDLIVKGMFDGRRQALLYVASSNVYRADRQSAPPLTRAALTDKVLAGGIISVMGVPPGTGLRAGIDRNLDGVLDGDVPAPQLRIARAETNAIVAWSTNANGFVLETTTSVPAANWSPETSLRSITSGEFHVTNSLSATNRFFRLKEL